MTKLPFPKLPPKAAYIHLNNPSKRNALSLAVLQDLRSQLHAHLSPPQTPNTPLLLPHFRPSLLPALESAADAPDPSSAEHAWLLSSRTWTSLRATLPTVLVLRSTGPVFSSGHDLRELSVLPRDQVRETFRLCAEVMTLLRRSPAPVVCAVQGLATAAGCQLALSADITIAPRGTKFALPGMSIGLPCTSPSTAVSRGLGSPALGYRMFATAEGVPAEDLGGAVDVAAAEGEEAFERRVEEVVGRLAESSGQAQAFGKWAYWTQMGIRGGDHWAAEGDAAGGGDGYEEAVEWAGRVMALHARMDDAREGIEAFLGKRKAEWRT